MRAQLIAVRIIAFAALLAVAGLLFAWSGLYNVAATAGHWPVVAWLLHYTMRNSVETHALAIESPPLDDLSMIERGAGHYETGCAPCHGAPGWAANRIPSSMLPPPPYLPSVVGEWSPEELFWIAKHGFKYTGMPAWPAQDRDDEVWAVTAFLLQLPDMSPDEYAALAGGVVAQASTNEAPALPEAPGELFTMSDAGLIAACARCHGLDGRGRESGAFPRLDIQTPEYLSRALEEYASGIRPSGIMQPVAAALDGSGRERLASHYSTGVSAESADAPAASAASIDVGEQIATVGIADRQIPACASCHGLEEKPENPLYPALAGQYSAFTLLQLDLWREGRRGGGAYADIMAPISSRLTSEEAQAVAHYYESLTSQAD